MPRSEMTRRTDGMEAPIGALIAAADRDDAASNERLFSVLYAELHRLAKREIARRGAIAGLGVTTLLHEAYLRMAGRDDASFCDRGRFMAYASRVMRGLIVEQARSGWTAKRGGRFEITSLDTRIAAGVVDDSTLSVIGDALDELATEEPALAEVVDLKFFCGFTVAEIAAMQGVAERTIHRKWQKARIYLYRRLRSEPGA